VLATLCALGASAVQRAPSGVANALMDAELASLRSAQDTVKKAQLDLDGIDQNDADVKLMGAKQATQEHSDNSGEEHPDLGEALMQQDDLNPAPELDNDAAVQVQATQNEVQAENTAEGEEKADSEDVKKVFDLAKSMKATDLLPEGWTEKFDQSSGQNYYENTLTKSTSWDPPRSLVGIALTAAQGQMQLKRELEEMKMKMRRSGERDLGESGDISADSQCPQTVSQLMKEAKELRATVKSLSSKLNLTGEQQKMLAKLMATTALPQVSPALMEAAKPKKAKTVKGVKKHLKNVSAKKGGDAEHGDLGESAGVKNWKGTGAEAPAELGEAAALEASDEHADEDRVDAELKAEAASVAKRFADDEADKEAIARKAAEDAGSKIDKKMEDDDAALMASDKEDDDRMNDIIGNQKSLETEQALFRGTMTPQQVNDVVDPDIADMEREDLTSGNDFQPMDEGVPQKAAAAPMK